MRPDTGELAELARTVRDLLAKQVHPTLPLADALGAPDAVWPKLAGELGLAGLLVPADLGGLDLGIEAAAVVAEELGRACYGGPFQSSCIESTSALSGLDHPLARELLTEMADGGRVTTIAMDAPAVSAGPDGELSGRTPPLLDAERADSLLVVIEQAGEPVLVAIRDLTDAGVTVTPVAGLDLARRLGTVTFSGTRSTVLATGADARAARDRAFALRGLVVGADAVGVAARALELTVEFVRTRVQFGRVVGSFQAIKHTLADLQVQLEVARSAVAFALRDGGPLGAHAVLAKAPEAAVTITTEALQLHGGIGFTWEYPAHVLLRRARADAALFGSPAHHRRALFTILDTEVPA